MVPLYVGGDGCVGVVQRVDPHKRPHRGGMVTDPLREDDSD